MKKKAKSTLNTPPNESQESETTYPEKPALRRVKAVDFEENRITPLGSILPYEATPKEIEEIATDQSVTSFMYTVRPSKLLLRAPAYVSEVSTAKSNPADPTVTRTDVHVITITPSWRVEELDRQGGAIPTAPTTKMLEYKNGSYEVIKNDAPIEHIIKTKRKSSHDSHDLDAAGSGAMHGLECVNTKLTDWSGTWPDSLKPAIVVSPDGSGHTPQYDCSVEHDEDIVVLVPPNSQRTSGAPSCFPSRPVSAPITRIASHDDMVLELDEEDEPPHDSIHWNIPKEQLPLVLNQECRATQLVDASRRMRTPVKSRKLSNIDDADIRFRGHRDSVIIARSRLVRSSGISPELVAYSHPDSTSKKSMHAKIYATLGREILHTRDIDSELLESFDDDEVSVVSLSPVKEHAA